MPNNKPKVGRPKHVAEYITGTDAQQNFSNAMRAILSSGSKKPQPKKRAA